MSVADAVMESNQRGIERNILEAKLGLTSSLLIKRVLHYLDHPGQLNPFIFNYRDAFVLAEAIASVRGRRTRVWRGRESGCWHVDWAA
jgi:hypothetical protein